MCTNFSICLSEFTFGPSFKNKNKLVQFVEQDREKHHIDGGAIDECGRRLKRVSSFCCVLGKGI